jgi:hypothetical protein
MFFDGAKPRDLRFYGLFLEVFLKELSWAFGPSKPTKNASVRQPPSMEPLPFPSSSRRSRHIEFIIAPEATEFPGSIMALRENPYGRHTKL